MGNRRTSLIAITALLAGLAVPSAEAARPADRAHDARQGGSASKRSAHRHSWRRKRPARKWHAPRSPKVPAIYVDGASVGGKCSDARSAGEAKSRSTPWCTFERATAAAPAGSLVFVRAGGYKSFALRSQREGNIAFRPYPGERPVLQGGTVLSDGIRLEGFRITGTVSLETGASQIALVSNDWITDGQTGGTSVNFKPGVRDVLIEGNRIGQKAGVATSNAINFSSTDARAAIENVRIRRNAIGPVPGGGDAIQAKNTRGLTIEENDIFGVSRPQGSGAHPDAIQSIYGSVDLVLRRNFIHDIAAQGVAIQVYRGANVSFRAEDNVVARVAYPWTAFAFETVGAYVHHNTVDGKLMMAGSSIDLVANIATNALAPLSGTQFARDDYNVSSRFTRPRGPNSIVGTPAYRDAARNDFTLRERSVGWRAAPGGADLGSRKPVFQG